MGGITATISSTELNKAIKAIRKVKTDVNRKTGNEIIKSAFEIERRAKRNTPVVTGRLRSSERILNRLKGNLGAEIGTDVVYATPVEENTPFLKPAFDVVSPKLVKAIGQILKNA